MKAFVSILGVAAWFCLSPNPVPAQPADDNLPVAPARPDAAEDDLRKGEKLLNESRDAQAQLEKAAADFQQQRVVMEKRLAEQNLKAAAVAAEAQRKYFDRAQNQNVARRNSGPATRALVIRSSESDPKELGNLEEDLAIMAHVFSKSLKENLGSAYDRKAMGIDLFFTPASSSVRSLYLEGYGALFVYTVNFPLLAPAGEGETAKDKAPADSTWDEAKHELYGAKTDGRNPTGPAEEFSSDKVTKLQNTLLESMKNAVNIRNLKPDDAITVCVFGGPSGGRYVKTKAKGKEVDETEVQEENRFAGGKALRGTVLTIRVKKSDTDAFATGKLTLEQFREKARIVAYTGSGINETSAFSFATGVFGGGGGVGFGGVNAVGGGGQE
jgi:hypothetical protein